MSLSEVDICKKHRSYRNIAYFRFLFVDSGWLFICVVLKTLAWHTKYIMSTFLCVLFNVLLCVCAEVNSLCPVGPRPTSQIVRNRSAAAKRRRRRRPKHTAATLDYILWTCTLYVAGRVNHTHSATQPRHTRLVRIRSVHFVCLSAFCPSLSWLGFGRLCIWFMR